MNNFIKGLYAIIPDKTIDLVVIEQILASGVCALQYRRKSIGQATKLSEGKQLKQLCQNYQTPLIINDDLDLCLTLDASGLHLGSGDIDLSSARAQLGSDKIIGTSCYKDLDLAILAEKKGADYVAFGALFPSKTKANAPLCPLAVISKARQYLNIPIVCIGGINSQNAPQAYLAGCDAVAMISGLFLANNDDFSGTSL